MKKLQFIMSGGDAYLDKLKGQIVTLTEVGHYITEHVTVITESGKELRVFIRNLSTLPEFASMVPETHCGSDYLKVIWLVGEARNDAHFRCPPSDLKKYEDENGVPWEDIRLFDVKRG